MTWPEGASRPRAITLIGWIFITVGAVGVITHARELRGQHAAELAPALASGLVAAIGGLMLLRGAAWARWLLLGWMAFHIVLSAVHSAEELLLHIAIFAPILFLLFRRAPAVRP
jgi:hypothetical protein